MTHAEQPKISIIDVHNRQKRMIFCSRRAPASGTPRPILPWSRPKGPGSIPSRYVRTFLPTETQWNRVLYSQLPEAIIKRFFKSRAWFQNVRAPPNVPATGRIWSSISQVARVVRILHFFRRGGHFI